MTLQESLLYQSREGLLPRSAHLDIAGRFGLTAAQVEEAALKLGVLPARYSRNRETISTAQQLLLFQSRVLVVGCGGLGGYIVEELARLGVGQLVVVDYDVFEEHNLNRQLFSTTSLLGKSKAEAAARRAVEINDAVAVCAVNEEFTPECAPGLLHGVQVAVDALDTIPARLALAKSCAASGIPMVHGAISGWYGQVTTQYPGDNTLDKIYGWQREEKGMETVLGNPSFTPALVASIETAEVCKILTGQGSVLRNRILYIDLLAMEFDEVRV